VTAPTTNGHRRTVGDLLHKDTGPGHPGEHGAYPKDPYPTLDVDEVALPTSAPEPDPNAQDTGTPRPVKYDLLPGWAKTPGGLRRNVGHNAPILVNHLAFLAFTRGYAVRPVGWAFRGAGRLVVLLVHYAIDIETLRMQRAAAKKGDGRARAYERKERHKTRRSRAGWTCAAVAAAGASVAVLTAPNLPVLLRLVLWAGALAGLAHVGRPQTSDGTTNGVLRPDQDQDPAKTLVRSERVVSVFDKAGIKGVMTFAGTHRRDHGAEGWEADVDLPEGTTVDEVQAKHAKLCSAWRVQKERLYLQRAGHEGQVRMTLFDQDPMTGDPVRTPLKDLKPRSFWAPVPIGTTAYGDPYSLVLPGTSGVWVCSAPGYGKTNFLQLVLAAANLGIRVRTFIHDGKGEGDLEVYGDHADHFSQGSSDAAGKACLRMLTMVRDLRLERASLIRRVRDERPDLMPSSQITRDVTEDPQWDLPLIVVLVDELNLMVKTSSGDEIQKQVAGIAEGCRSGGIIPVIAGQRFDAAVLGGAQSSMGTRVAFKTSSPNDSNMILGQGQVGDGFNTSRWPDDYQGVAIVRPAGKQVQSGTHQVKMHLGEYQDHVAIAAHAGRQRIAAGGVTLAKGPADLLGRVLAAMGTENIVPVDELAEALGASDVEQLVADLRTAGVPVKKSRGHGNRRAVWRQDVLARM
jgi:S-DNA-T family DNA segregation ATPase FtsK/SpoIIIE